ncbi:hypothetical protein DSECCO2_516740 [anaerobic digester metagenome]
MLCGKGSHQFKTPGKQGPDDQIHIFHFRIVEYPSGFCHTLSGIGIVNMQPDVHTTGSQVINRNQCAFVKLYKIERPVFRRLFQRHGIACVNTVSMFEGKRHHKRQVESPFYRMRGSTVHHR